MSDQLSPRAVVLLSGGLDSATVLAMAIAQGYETYALSFDYGQRHQVELVAARRVVTALGAKQHRILNFDLTQWGGSALTDRSLDVPESPSEGIPVTYVPARNTIFLSLALAWAETLGANSIFAGMNAVDYSGYPDCRPEYVAAFQTMARLATRAGVEAADNQSQLTIRTPIIHMSKADIVKAGTALGIDYGITVSCYQADAEGRACGRCDSCRLRREGFDAAGIPDPTRYA
ncbi:7-cyano-7-deazaguanine synthase [Betaproteobacteria bacterium UKL13-2]|jgi:7-cyano-7-deazaguanine synthase|nr:7-cyano-7-deazaguanine synthase [Betaproteobacteria bacterium UKL13-2]HCG52672.1 7-cyano-7-deazaguanine synthase QueC [Betaproteobacteria bacterium]